MRSSARLYGRLKSKVYRPRGLVMLTDCHVSSSPGDTPTFAHRSICNFSNPDVSRARRRSTLRRPLTPRGLSEMSKSRRPAWCSRASSTTNAPRQSMLLKLASSRVKATAWLSRSTKCSMGKSRAVEECWQQAGMQSVCKSFACGKRSPRCAKTSASNLLHPMSNISRPTARRISVRTMHVCAGPPKPRPVSTKTRLLSAPCRPTAVAKGTYCFGVMRTPVRSSSCKSCKHGWCRVRAASKFWMAITVPEPARGQPLKLKRINCLDTSLLSEMAFISGTSDAAVRRLFPRRSISSRSSRCSAMAMKGFMSRSSRSMSCTCNFAECPVAKGTASGAMPWRWQACKYRLWGASRLDRTMPPSGGSNGTSPDM
mmetsp:Transcript_43223/g.124970  ORF Transcript_43223/g.124970 Transcript_43223/m.124970 type:complete len:370 (+) Transcript_43223:182-1291(+)